MGCIEAARAVFRTTQGHRAGRLIPLPLQRRLGHTGAVPRARPPPSAEPLSALSSLTLQPQGQPWSLSWWQNAGQLSSLSQPWSLTDEMGSYLPTCPTHPSAGRLPISPTLSSHTCYRKDPTSSLPLRIPPQPHPLFLFFIPPATPHGWCDLSSWTRDWTHTLDSECMKSQLLKPPGRSFPCFPLFLICLWGNCRSTSHQSQYRIMMEIMPYCLHAQSCLTLCDPMDCSPPGSSVHGILQAGILKWIAISFSRGYSWPRDQTQVSCVPCTDRLRCLNFHQ